MLDEQNISQEINKGIFMKKLLAVIENVNGRVGAPILMYLLGVPGFICVLAWLFFFRGH